jgi:hypothetical protein
MRKPKNVLKCLNEMVHSCRSLRTSPPPAIAGTQAKQLHDDLQRCGRISQVNSNDFTTSEASHLKGRSFLNILTLGEEQTLLNIYPITLKGSLRLAPVTSQP